MLPRQCASKRHKPTTLRTRAEMAMARMKAHLQPMQRRAKCDYLRAPGGGLSGLSSSSPRSPSLFRPPSAHNSCHSSQRFQLTHHLLSASHNHGAQPGCLEDAGSSGLRLLERNGHGGGVRRPDKEGRSGIGCAAIQCRAIGCDDHDLDVCADVDDDDGGDHDDLGLSKRD